MPGELKDIRMMKRALQQRWPIKPEYREAVVRRLTRIIADPSSTPREVAAASRALLAAESQNQTDEHKVIDVRVATRHDKLDAIARDLGIDPALIAAAEDEAVGGVAGTESGDAASPPA